MLSVQGLNPALNRLSDDDGHALFRRLFLSQARTTLLLRICRL